MNAMTYSQFKASGQPGHYDPDTDAYYSDDDYRALIAQRQAALTKPIGAANEPVELVVKAELNQLNEKPVKRSKA